MTNTNNNMDEKTTSVDQTSEEQKKKQEQSDPQLTELRGFTNPDEDLEPTLTDGTKSPDKAKQ